MGGGLIFGEIGATLLDKILKVIIPIVAVFAIAALIASWIQIDGINPDTSIYRTSLLNWAVKLMIDTIKDMISQIVAAVF